MKPIKFAIHGYDAVIDSEADGWPIMATSTNSTDKAIEDIAALVQQANAVPDLVAMLRLWQRSAVTIPMRGELHELTDALLARFEEPAP